MKKVTYLYNLAKRYYRLKKYQQRLRRRIALSMFNFQHAPVADINPLTGRFVRENGMKLYN